MSIASEATRLIREFHRPSTIDEALRLKAAGGADSAYLAGGTLINSSTFDRPCRAVIDVSALGLDRIDARSDGIAIGAGSTLSALVDSPVVPGALRQAARQVGSRNIRNAATVGGQVGANQPTGALLPTLLVLGATVIVETLAGPRELAVERLLEDGPDGLITWIHLPRPAPCRGVGLACYSRTANDLTLMTAAAALDNKGDRLESPIIALGGVADHAGRLVDVERELDGKPLPDRESVESLVGRAISPRDDHRLSADFKRHLAAVLVARSLAAAWQEGGSAPPAATAPKGSFL